MTLLAKTPGSNSMQRRICTLHGKSAFAVSMRPCHRLVLRLANLRQINEMQRFQSSRVTSTARDSESADKIAWVQTANMVRTEGTNL